MASAILRKQNPTNLYRHFITTTTKQNPTQYTHNNNITSSFSHSNVTQRCYYSRLFKRDQGKGGGVDVSAAATPIILGSSSAAVCNKIGFVGWYLGLIKSRPVLTKSVTCSLIYIAADLTSQTISLESTESYDFKRSLRMGGYGMFILGPTLHYWFNFMSRILPGRGLLTTVKKMALGQTVYGPCLTVVFFSLNAALQGEHYREIVARLKRDLLPTLLNGAMYWPLCDFITFRFVPVHLQPLVSNAFSYVWTIYMTYMASLDRPSTE